MMVGMVVAGIGFVLAGLLAIGFGIPVKEFGFGNTLILAGVTGVCTGAIMLGLWATVRELRNIAQRRGAGGLPSRGDTVRPVLPPGAAVSGDGGFLFDRDQHAAEKADHAGTIAPAAPSVSAPWQDETANRARPSPETEPAEAVPPVKPKRNLLFSSTSRKERERAQARTSEPKAPDLLSAELRPNPMPQEPIEPPPSFDDAWPKSERSKASEVPPQRHGDASPAASGGPMRNENHPEVTVLKSGVVDGMAYSLYSDGSIEAQMPEGMMRFASIDELRAHLDHRP